MKRKTLFMMLVSFSTMAVLTVSVLVGVGKTKKFASKTSANDTYTQTLNSSIFSMSSLTTDYQTNVQQSFGASLPHAVSVIVNIHINNTINILIILLFFINFFIINFTS